MFISVASFLSAFLRFHPPNSSHRFFSPSSTLGPLRPIHAIPSIAHTFGSWCVTRRATISIGCSSAAGGGHYNDGIAAQRSGYSGVSLASPATIPVSSVDRGDPNDESPHSSRSGSYQDGNGGRGATRGGTGRGGGNEAERDGGELQPFIRSHHAATPLMRPSEIALEPPSADVPSPSAFLPPMSPESIPLGLSSLRSLSALSATPLWPPPPVAELPRAAADHGPRIAAAAVDVADRLLSTVPPLLTQAMTSAAGGVHRYLQRFSVYVIIANAARPVLRPAVDKAQEVLDKIPPMSTIPGRLTWLTILLLLAWAACALPSLLSTLHDPQYYSASPFPRRIPVLGDGGSAPVFSDAGFNVEAAAKMWEAKVGCARFRWKHRDLLKKYSYSSTFPRSSSLQDPNRVACRRMQLRHVTILLPPGAESWMWPHKLEGFYHCPRCGITCQISWSPLMALQADATLHVWPADPPAERTRGQPLRVYLNLESWGLLEKRRLFDVGVSPFASSDVQLTYSGVHHTLETGRRQFFSKIKRQDVPLYRASSHCQYEWREGLVRDVFALVPHHSFGHCDNNMNGSDAELLLYPECTHPVISVLKQEISACAMSHYKFILSTENTRVPGYVTEKALEPLEAGTVPVYYGAPDIHQFMPPESFIDGSKYTASQLATLITALNNDPVRYMNYFAWRMCGVPGPFAHVTALNFDSFPCRLCEAVSARGGKMF
ncbi:unnamed protein product [Closterium sp. Yama58-4]|nr:unnamed protein product [Closterium sp. Yama58-4]